MKIYYKFYGFEKHYKITFYMSELNDKKYITGVKQYSSTIHPKKIINDRNNQILNIKDEINGEIAKYLIKNTKNKFIYAGISF